MDDMIAANIIAGPKALEDNPRRTMEQCDEANRVHGEARLRQLGLSRVAGGPRTSSELAVYGGSYFVNESEGNAPIYLLDLERREAILPVWKTARQERQVRDLLSRLKCCAAPEAEESEVLSRTLGERHITNPEAFLHVCSRVWQGWPVKIRVNFSVFGDSICGQTVEFLPVRGEA